jgi:competence protein ComGC
MADYWVKRTQFAEIEGPYEEPTFQAMAARGEIGLDALISSDRVNWSAAGQVRGLFAEAATVSVPPVQAQTYAMAEPGLPPLPLGYSGVSGVAPVQPMMGQPMVQYFQQGAIRTRNVKWYLIVSVILIVLGALSMGLQMGYTVHFVQGGNGRGAVPQTLILVMIISGLVRLLAFGGMLGLWIYFTIWAYQIHAEMREWTGGAYPISPGKACGFCYIPFFNIYWLVYMPYKLAAAVNRHLGPTGRRTSPGAVMTFQILQQTLNLVCGCIMVPNMLFAALSMRNIQNGLNELAMNVSPANVGLVPGQPTGPYIGGSQGFVPLPMPMSAVAAERRTPWGWIIFGIVGGLAVVAIFIALLASILLPSLSRAREIANRAKCAANMRMIGIGLVQYASQNNGQYPGRLEDAVLAGTVTPNVLICPDSNDTVATGNTPAQWAASITQGGHCSYVYSGAGYTTGASNAAGTVLLYEPTGAHQQAGVNILTGDGAVVFFNLSVAQGMIRQAQRDLHRRLVGAAGP